jgi:NTE family protein
MHKVEYSVATLLDQLPDEFKQSEEAKFLASIAQRHAYNLVHLIYRPRGFEGDSNGNGDEITIFDFAGDGD